MAMDGDRQRIEEGLKDLLDRMGQRSLEELAHFVDQVTKNRRGVIVVQTRAGKKIEARFMFTMADDIAGQVRASGEDDD